MIESLEIKGLFGYLDKEINFKKEINFLVGINGSGKTTILKIISAFLKNDVHFFENLDFTYIKMTKKEHQYVIYKKHIDVMNIEKKKIGYFYIADTGIEQFQSYKDDKMIFKKFEILTENASYASKLPENWVENNKGLLEIGLEKEFNDKKIIEFFKKIKEEKEHNNDLENEFKSILTPIEQVKKILKEIGTEHLVEKSKINSKFEDIEVKYKLDFEFSKEESEEDLKKFKDLYYKFMTKKKHESKVLKKIVNYENIVNIFLTETYKKIVFDSILGEFKIVILDKSKQKELKVLKNFNNLSSGEKQILILATLLYFNNLKEKTILIDEPELSLHIEWQKNFLKMLNPLLKKNNQILIATHSPNLASNVDRSLFIPTLPYTDNDLVEMEELND